MLAGEPIDLCAVTEFERVRETAELALAGRDVPFLVVPELNDPRYGEFEGGSLDTYREWVWERGPLEAPAAGSIAARSPLGMQRGFRQLLERPEETILLVAHSLPLRYVLDAGAGTVPAREGRRSSSTRRRSGSTREDARARAVDVLEEWAGAPSFRCTIALEADRQLGRGWRRRLAAGESDRRCAP